MLILLFWLIKATKFQGAHYEGNHDHNEFQHYAHHAHYEH